MTTSYNNYIVNNNNKVIDVPRFGPDIRYPAPKNTIRTNPRFNPFPTWGCAKFSCQYSSLDCCADCRLRIRPLSYWWIRLPSALLEPYYGRDVFNTILTIFVRRFKPCFCPFVAFYVGYTPCLNYFKFI